MTNTDKTVFPERDTSRPAEEQGLFRKFDVRRVDGSDAPGGKHHGCRYFVLDVDHDQHAVDALIAYANSCEKTHPELARDLREDWAIPSSRTQEPTEWQVEVACREYARARYGDTIVFPRDFSPEEVAKSREDMRAALRAASITPPAPERSKEDVRDILQAVAHIGVDFGYGPYVLEEKFIKAAQELLNASPFPLPVTITDEMVDRACKMHNVGWSLWHEPQKKTAREVMRAALTAALSKPREQG